MFALTDLRFESQPEEPKKRPGRLLDEIVDMHSVNGAIRPAGATGTITVGHSDLKCWNPPLILEYAKGIVPVAADDG
jgi:hypothetical protein